MENRASKVNAMVTDIKGCLTIIEFHSADPTTVTLNDIQCHVNKIMLGVDASLPRLEQRTRSKEELRELNNFFATMQIVPGRALTLPDRKWTLMTDLELELWDNVLFVTRLIALRDLKVSKLPMGVIISFTGT